MQRVVVAIQPFARQGLTCRSCGVLIIVIVEIDIFEIIMN